MQQINKYGIKVGDKFGLSIVTKITDKTCTTESDTDCGTGGIRRDKFQHTWNTINKRIEKSNINLNT